MVVILVPQVPPIVIAIANNRPTIDKFDLSSVQALFTGAAPLGEEVAQKVLKQHPSWKIRQGYGDNCILPGWPLITADDHPRIDGNLHSRRLHRHQ